MEGISFDMSQQSVLEKLKRTDKVIEVTADRVISEGPWDINPSIRRKTFSFQENKLQCIRYQYIKGNDVTPNITFTFCK